MIANYGKIYNTVSIEETELESLMLMAMMVYSAVARKGSRGGLLIKCREFPNFMVS